MDRKLTVILYADVADYSRMMGDDEDRTHQSLNDGLNKLIAEIEKNGGRKVHEAGDAILAEFSSVVSAVTCALTFQNQMVTTNTAVLDTQQIIFRIGINLGEVIIDRNDIYGDGVNIAARLEGLAKPGCICISNSVYDQIPDKISSAFFDHGNHQVKNITKPVRVYGNFEPNKEVDPAPAVSPFFGAKEKASISITGGCLCGEVRLHINHEAIDTMYCHCSMCQRFSGAPVVAASCFPRESVEFTAGNPKYFEMTHDHTLMYQSSLIAERGFCPNCGSSILYRPIVSRLSDWVVIFTACLDNAKDFAPTWHLGVESKMPWLHIQDDFPKVRCEDSPGLVAAWASVNVSKD